jgi:hypothetical protein
MLRKAFVPVMILFLCFGPFTKISSADDALRGLHSQINKLGAGLHILESVKMRINARFIDQNTPSPIDGNTQLPAVEGLVGMLEATAIQLLVVERRVVSVLDAYAPGTLLPEGVQLLLDDIYFTAEDLKYIAGIVIEILPSGDDYEGVRGALDNVIQNANSIMEAASGYRLPSQ